LHELLQQHQHFRHVDTRLQHWDNGVLRIKLSNSALVFLRAGIMGYAWVAVLHYWMQLTFKTTLLIATAMPALWLAVFHALLRLSQPRSRQSIHFDAEPAVIGGLKRLSAWLLTAGAGLAMFVVHARRDLGQPALRPVEAGC
jgi:hypothetical protein